MNQGQLHSYKLHLTGSVDQDSTLGATRSTCLSVIHHVAFGVIFTELVDLATRDLGVVSL